MAKSKGDTIAIYQRNLERYEAEGDEEKVAVERRLIARLEKDV